MPLTIAESTIGPKITAIDILIIFVAFLIGVLVVRFIIRRMFSSLPSYISTILSSLLPVYLGLLLKPLWMKNDSLLATVSVPFILLTTPILVILLTSSWIKKILNQQKNLQMNTSHKPIKAILVLAILIALPILTNGIFVFEPIAQYFKEVGSNKNYIDGCLDVTFSEQATRANVTALLTENNIEVPEFGDPTTYKGAFLIPYFRAFTYDYDVTQQTLLRDQRIAHVEKNSGPNIHDGKYDIFVIFTEQITVEEGHRILSDEYRLEVNGSGTKRNTLRLDTLLHGSENLITTTLRKSSLIEDIDRCEEIIVRPA